LPFRGSEYVRKSGSRRIAPAVAPVPTGSREVFCSAADLDWAEVLDAPDLVRHGEVAACNQSMDRIVRYVCQGVHASTGKPPIQSPEFLIRARVSVFRNCPRFLQLHEHDGPITERSPTVRQATDRGRAVPRSVAASRWFDAAPLAAAPGSRKLSFRPAARPSMPGTWTRGAANSIANSNCRASGDRDDKRGFGFGSARSLRRLPLLARRNAARRGRPPLPWRLAQVTVPGVFSGSARVRARTG
jgi:hypothetical protein